MLTRGIEPVLSTVSGDSFVGVRCWYGGGLGVGDRTVAISEDPTEVSSLSIRLSVAVVIALIVLVWFSFGRNWCLCFFVVWYVSRGNDALSILFLNVVGILLSLSRILSHESCGLMKPLWTMSLLFVFSCWVYWWWMCLIEKRRVLVTYILWNFIFQRCCSKDWWNDDTRLYCIQQTCFVSIFSVYGCYIASHHCSIST